MVSKSRRHANASVPAADPGGHRARKARGAVIGRGFESLDCSGGIGAGTDIARQEHCAFAQKPEWQVIAPETTQAAQLFVGYVMPLAVLAALIGFVRMSVIGVNTAFGGGFRMPLGTGLTYTVLTLVSALIGVFIVGLIINGLAPTFSGQRDQRQALKVSAYSLTPAMLSSVLALSPILPTLLQFLAGCYGIYVLYLGLPVLMQSPKEKAFGYTASVVICTILVGVVFGIFMTFAHIGGARAGFLGATPASRAAEQAAARDQGAAAVGNAIGNMLGTDAKGKADLGAALSNLTKAGEQAQASAALRRAPSATARVRAVAAQNAPSPLAAAWRIADRVGRCARRPESGRARGFQESSGDAAGLIARHAAHLSPGRKSGRAGGADFQRQSGLRRERRQRRAPRDQRHLRRVGLDGSGRQPDSKHNLAKRPPAMRRTW